MESESKRRVKDEFSAGSRALGRRGPKSNNASNWESAAASSDEKENLARVLSSKMAQIDYKIE